MVKRIVWTKPALNDKLKIFAYWNHRNKSNLYSRILNNLFKDTTRLVRDNPTLGRDTENPQVKNIIVRDYLIFYEPTEDTIVVLHIWDSRRNPDELKYKLK